MEQDKEDNEEQKEEEEKVGLGWGRRSSGRIFKVFNDRGNDDQNNESRSYSSYENEKYNT